MLAIFLFSITTVCASEIGTSIASEDTSQMGLSGIDKIIEDNLQTSEEKPTLAVGENDESLSSKTDSEILTADQFDYTYLKEQIGSGGNINLTKGTYTYDNDGDTIEITASGVINGNGAVIDMALSGHRAFNVTASDVTIRNLTIKNANFDGDGGAIYFSGFSTVENCNFYGNNATYAGGAVYFKGNGTVINCNFTGNKATKSGGAILFAGNGNIGMCNFTNNSASNGGAIYFNGDVNNVAVIACFKSNAADRAGGAIYVKGKSADNNFMSQFYDNEARQASGGAMFFYSLAENNTFESDFANNYALYGGGIFFYKKANDNRFNSNFTLNVVESCGGAIFFYNTTNNNNFTGYFTNNSALGKVDASVGNGGAITFKDVSTNSIFTGDFINNTAALNGGGVNYRQTPHNITFNCNFIGNDAPTGGGVNFFESFENVIFNGEFIGNSAVNGGAIAVGEGIIKDVSFKNNTAANNGGAVYFSQSGNVLDCNFSNNNATYDGGAVYFNRNGNVTDCNFTGNTASRDGGAVYFYYDGNVTNCNFINNTAAERGGAVYFNGNGEVTDCNFTDNSAGYQGGAVYFISSGATHEVRNCNFTDNCASSQGGAIRFSSSGTVTNCNFTGNNAATGSAICFWSTSATKTVSDSCFLNNRANAETFEVTKNENNITITFTGKDNLLNAIFSRGDVSFTNVTYWGADGIANTDSSTQSRSNNEAGQNITIAGVVNGNIINMTNITDSDGKIVLENAGDYYLVVCHDEDSYYTEIEKTFTNMNFHVNVTSMTTTNRTVNITAESNIYAEVMPGKLLFILPDNDAINAAYAADGTWWALYAFDDAGDYNVSAAYVGLDNVAVSNATISIRYDTRVDVNNRTLDLFIGDNFTIVATTTPEGLNVSYVPDNSGVYSVDENGNVIALREGTGSIWITVGGDGVYALNSTFVNVTVKDPFRNVTVEDVIKYFSGPEMFIVNVTNSKGKAVSGETVLITINGVTYNRTTDENGIARLSINLNSGVFDANTTVGNVTVASQVTVMTTVEGEDIESELRNVTYYAFLVDGEGNPLENGTVVNFNIEGIIYSGSVRGDEGIASVDLILNSGKYIITAINPLTRENHANNITIDAKDPLINITCDEITEGENAVVNVTLPDDATGTVRVGDEEIPLANGTAIAVLTDLPVGNTTIPISYSGDGRYNPVESNVTVTVNPKENLTIFASADPIIVGENATIIVTGLENATGNVSARVGDGIYFGDIIDGTAEIIVPGLIENTTAFIFYAGDGKYNNASAEVEIIVNENRLFVSAPDVTKYYGGNESFIVRVYDSFEVPIANKSVNVILNNVSYDKTTDSNGTVTIALNLNSGIYNVTTAVDDMTVNSTVTVLSTVNGTDVVKVFRNATQFYATFRDSVGNYLAEGSVVQFNINGVFYGRAVGANGVAKLNINLEQGNYVITSINNWTGENAANNVTVIPTLIGSGDLVKYYKNDSQYVLKVMGDDGNPVGAGVNVTFNINGVFYTRATNESGMVKLNINIHPGEYIITAEYNGCKVSDNIKVLPVLSADDLTKKYGTPDQFVATVLDGEGNALSGADVEFNINGVFYNKVTDSEGHAKLNINLMPGEYIITSTYNETSVANTIKVAD